jgi:hypothetical protein
MNKHLGITFTHHARLRMAQRNVSLAQIWFILGHGHRCHRAGVVLVHLRRKDIPADDLANSQISCLEGTTVVLNRKGTAVMTVWRNRNRGMQQISRKPRFAY